MGIRERRVRKGIAVWEKGEDGFLYMPGQILIDVPDEQLAVRVLDGAIERRRDLNTKLGVAHYDVRGDVPALVERLRKEGVRSGPEPRARGEPRYKGGPGTDVAPGHRPGRAVRRRGPRRAHRGARHRVHVGHPRLARRHASTRTGSCSSSSTRLAGDGQLDDEAGHGTFIAGIINRLAPAARITARQVLLSDGWGDEATISAAIADCTEADVINLSLRRLHAGQRAADRPRERAQERAADVGRRRGGRQRRVRRAVLAGGAEAGRGRRRGRLRRRQGGLLELRRVGQLRGARATR